MTEPRATRSRRSVLHGAGLLGMSAGLGLTGLLGACDDDENRTGAGRGGGTLTLGIDGTSAVNDPALYTTLGDWMAVDCICRGLTFISFESNDPEPDLAESWQISADELTYTFSLRRGVTFHDGSTFTSADVLASLNRQFDAGDRTLPDGAARPLRGLGANLASLTAPDPGTVVLALKTPDATVLARLSDIGGRIISKAALDRYGKDIGRNLVGTGPFRFASATSGRSVVLAAFDRFRLGRPPIDRLVLRQVRDPSAIVSSLLSGDLSATQFTPYSALEQLRGNDAVRVHETPYSFDAMLLIDARRIRELDVRRAINLAVDREAILAQAFFGSGAPPVGYAIPPTQPGHDPGLADLSTTDVDEAKRLIRAAGAAGREVRLMAASDGWHPEAARIIARNLTDVGLTVRRDSADPATYFGRLTDPDDEYHELMLWERNSYVPDPDNMIGAMALPSGVYGDRACGLSTLDGAAGLVGELNAAKNMPNGPGRTAAYSGIQRLFAERYMVLSMLAYSCNPVVSGAKVEGMNVAALGSHRCFMEKANV